MCTVSFITRPQGYALAMNRDEQRSRQPGLPPQLRKLSRHVVLCPSESGGGTWVALNDAGVTFALINWYSVPQNIDGPTISRGEVVNAVSGKSSSLAVTQRLEELPLSGLKPFRLIGVFPDKSEIVQWQWDLEQLTSVSHDWRAQQWISSGFDEPTAQRVRSLAFAEASLQKNFGSLEWLRAVHSSHTPETGPFSTCMHRADAVTVSCTEIVVSNDTGIMTYLPGSPCECLPNEVFQFRMPLKTGTLAPAIEVA